MKTPLFPTMLTLAVFQFSVTTAQVSQEDTTKLASTDQSAQSVNFGPTFGSENISNLSYYAVTANDPRLFQMSAGVSVLNTLRGQAPGLSLSAQAPFASGAFRTGSPVYVIDGLTFNNVDHYNMNASEYQSISVINSGNAAARYGSAGLNSVVLLQRKTGANVSRPTFEVMSYTTFAKNKMSETGFGTETEPVNRWLFTNGVAYTQDFGILDTRVSYTYSRFPSTDGFDTETDIHTTSINTGLELGKRFSARLILDQFSQLSEIATSNEFLNTDITNNYDGKQTFLQGNLSLNYQLLDGLKLSSQAAISREKDEFKQSYYESYLGLYTYGREYEHQQRSFINLFLTGDSELTTGFKLNYAAGYQLEKSNPYRDTGIDRAGYKSQMTYGYEVRTKSIISELGLNYQNYLSLALNYQHNDFDNDENNTYAIGSGFIFTEAFKWSNEAFSMGKIRVSYSKADISNNATFPYELSFTGMQTAYAPVEGSNFEAGIDLGFLNNQITLSANGYYNFDENLYALTNYNSPSPILVDVGSFSTEGWEIIAGAQIIEQRIVQWSSKINWRKFESKIETDFMTSVTNNGNSQWEGGWLNTISFNNFFFSFLIDTRQNIPLLDYDVIGSSPVYTLKEVSMTKLRDVSIGWNILPGNPQGNILKALHLSLSGRNLWTIKTNHDTDVESTINNYTLLKNFSLSIGATF